VQLHKTYDNLSAHETAAQTVKAQSVQTQNTKVQAAKPAAGAVPKMPPSATQQAATRSISSLISSTGLPADKLSASIISFARFFSLPLKPELLKHIRQQAFTMTPNVPPAAAGEDASKAGTVFKNRETLSLAASAAEGKGVELQPKSLETYAQAIDPESRRDDEHGDRRGRHKAPELNKNDHDNDSEHIQKTGAISAGSLEKMALEMAEKNPLLAILNRLPGKDGKRWIVLPFDFSDDGREFKVSLRILLETGKTVNRAACLALDIAIRNIIESGSAVENGGTEKRRLFVFEPANRLSVCLQPEITPTQQAGLVRELSALLEIAPDRIFIKTQTETFPFEAGCPDDLLDSVDEAV